MMTQEHWPEWNRQGLVPGPEESETEYNKRAGYCLSIKENLDVPFPKEDEATPEALKNACAITQTLFGIAPTWVPLFFNNAKLAPWHGGCAWIFQLDENSPYSALLQLRAPFRDKATYLGLYHRDELIAHEIAHIGRMMYQENKSEELFAYQTSSSWFQRWLGPLFQSSIESFLFVLVTALAFFMNIVLISVDSRFIGLSLWIPAILLFLAFLRLMWRRRRLNQCLSKLRLIFPNDADHLLYRLRDEEIALFAHSPPDHIIKLMHQWALENFRWRFLVTLYPTRLL